MDEDEVLEFLTSLEAMDLPDQIEEVNAKILEKIVQEEDFVAVLFCNPSQSIEITSRMIDAALLPQICRSARRATRSSKNWRTSTTKPTSWASLSSRSSTRNWPKSTVCLYCRL